ncbi:DUF3027 domain-containing protein [Nocardioides massiliensis]|uniref:DUF3027 domain-containing protein n=1 Tax=Nocardioides massiliensis TaxID=1325935 RepID=A0ABT9NP13_9ACTN|nr:DUF3027 domain-containing protein [Nocardioides massiliensis]MDP9822144.1 hypothetical protein [Nocardioides massiliensis]
MVITSRPSKPDAVAAAAVDVARAALLEQVTADEVGEHLGVQAEAERVVTHLFACTKRGYRGWTWAVDVVRAPRLRTVTVNDVVLLPGDEAIVAPAWVPYKDRVAPGDLSPGDLLPVEADDPRLVPGQTAGDEIVDRDAMRDVIHEVGLGRPRVLSIEGRDQAAQRWYDGDQGPESPLAQAAPGQCVGCGFLVRLAGPLSRLFGVCANGNANDDGRVVSFDHGCGAHSEVRLSKKHQPEPLPEPVLDEESPALLETF